MSQASEAVLKKRLDLRAALQGALLLIVLVSGFVPLLPLSVGAPRRLPEHLTDLLGDGRKAAVDPAAHWFDPRYGPFLEAVAGRTTPESTVAVVTGPGELYVYCAAYDLAPRRVVFPPNTGGAAAIAYFRPGAIIPKSEALPDGALLRK